MMKTDGELTVFKMEDRSFIDSYREFSEETTHHGLKYITNKTASPVRR